MWTPHAEQVVSRLIAGISPEKLDPTTLANVERLQALYVGTDMWAGCYLRPNGEVVFIGSDWDRPDEASVSTERSVVLRMIVWGSERYPELRELLPVRPPHAFDCPCRQNPLFAEGKVLCQDCGGMGWLPMAESLE
jgi:hypothetical protein